MRPRAAAQCEQAWPLLGQAILKLEGGMWLREVTAWGGGRVGGANASKSKR